MDWVLHFGHDGPGVEAVSGQVLGFGTWAPDEAALLKNLPGKLQRHREWAAGYGISVPNDDGIRVVARVHTSEGLLPVDEAPATTAEVDLTMELLRASRASLLETLSNGAAEHTTAVLDWDPPYARFAKWANWRTIRANLAHVANAEIHYYCRQIGHRTRLPVYEPQSDWSAMLDHSRAETMVFLEGLRTSDDLLREIREDEAWGVEHWTVRKSLRRMIRHELMHWRSIQRIVSAYA
jgi:hypothetical protein